MILSYCVIYPFYGQDPVHLVGCFEEDLNRENKPVTAVIFLEDVNNVAMPVVEFSREGFKITKFLA